VATGLIALLDDVASIAKVAAASLDDVAGQAAKAGAKAAGVVIDDAAVTPRYVVGFAADRELPIVGKIALGSLKNKLFYLLPGALILSVVSPAAITPLLMLGGAYLCYEGTEKAFEALFPHKAHHHEKKLGVAPADPAALEAEKVSGAIRTDFILSAEIMAITLAAVPNSVFITQAATLAAVGVGITALVYGGVALIVKADDAGVALAAEDRPVSSLFRRPPGPPSTADRLLRRLTQSLGRAIVLGMPRLLKTLSVIGTAAMIWVGGGIIVHGLEKYGLAAPAHAIHAVAETVAHAVPAIGGAILWLVEAAAYGVVGLVLGALLIPLTEHVLAPLVRRIRALARPPGGGYIRRARRNRRRP
jgi:predicted DNA repair protein MutK